MDAKTFKPETYGYHPNALHVNSLKSRMMANVTQMLHTRCPVKYDRTEKYNTTY